MDDDANIMTPLDEVVLPTDKFISGWFGCVCFVHKHCFVSFSHKTQPNTQCNSHYITHIKLHFLIFSLHFIQERKHITGLTTATLTVTHYRITP